MGRRGRGLVHAGAGVPAARGVVRHEGRSGACRRLLLAVHRSMEGCRPGVPAVGGDGAREGGGARGRALANDCRNDDATRYLEGMTHSITRALTSWWWPSFRAAR